jgi:hypothetical protein
VSIYSGRGEGAGRTGLKMLHVVSPHLETHADKTLHEHCSQNGWTEAISMVMSLFKSTVWSVTLNTYTSTDPTWINQYVLTRFHFHQQIITRFIIIIQGLLQLNHSVALCLWAGMALSFQKCICEGRHMSWNQCSQLETVAIDALLSSTIGWLQPKIFFSNSFPYRNSHKPPLTNPTSFTII